MAKYLPIETPPLFFRADYIRSAGVKQDYFLVEIHCLAAAFWFRLKGGKFLIKEVSCAVPIIMVGFAAV
jgi:hypothetical protein